MEWLRKNLAVITALVGLVSGWAVMNFRLDIQDKAIQELKGKQNTTDVILVDINRQLTDMNTKMDLILSGKIKITLVDEGR